MSSATDDERDANEDRVGAIPLGKDVEARPRFLPAELFGGAVGPYAALRGEAERFHLREVASTGGAFARDVRHTTRSGAS